MKMLKKITKVLLITLASLLVIVFCLLFTAPGNHFIAFTANKLVDGLSIKLPSGRFLYNDAFDVHFENQSIKFDAKQLKIDLFWWRCDGVCLDNLSAQSIDLNIKSQAASTEQSTETEPNVEQVTQISLPMKVVVKRVAINRFNLAHPSADVTVNKLNLSARGEASDLTVDTLTIADVAVMLHETKEQPKSAPLTELPALPAIDIRVPIDVELKQFQISKVAITPYGAEQAQLIENIELVASAKESDINLKKFAASYQQWQLHTNLTAELSGENTIEGAVSVKSTEHQANLSLSGPLADLKLSLVTQGTYPAQLKGAVNLKQTNYPFDLTGQIAKWQIATDTQQLQLSDFDLKAKGHADAYAVDLSLVTQLDALPAMTVKSKLQGSLTNAKLEQLSLNANDSKADINASVDWSNGVKSEFKGALSHLKAQYLTDALSSDLSGEFNGSFNLQAGEWKLALDNTQLNGSVNQIPVTLLSDFELDSSLHASFKKLEIKSGKNEIALSGQVDKVWRVDGKLRLDASDQDVLPMQGKGFADLSLRGERLEPTVDLSLVLNTLSYQDIQVDGLTLKGQFDYAANWQTDVSLVLDSASIAEHKINQIELDASGDKTDHHLTFLLDADQGKASFDVDGKFNKETWQGALSQILVTDNQVRFGTNKPVNIQVNTKTFDFNVGAHCWQSDNSKLCFETLQQTKQLGQLNAQLAALSIAEFKHFLPDNLKVTGDANGEFVANWNNGALKTIRANIKTQQLEASLIDGANVYKLPVEVLEVSAMSDAQVGKLNATLDSSVLGKVTSELNIDDIQNQQNLAGDLVIEKIELTNLRPFISSLEQLTGDIKGRLAIAGTLKEPLLNGDFDVEKINLEGATLPVSLQNSYVNIAFNNQSATLKGELKDAEGGALDLSGGIDWQQELPDVDVKLNGKEFFVRAQQDVTFKVSPDLTMSLKDNAFNLDGQVVVPWGRIAIEELPEGAVQVSDDEVIVDIEQQQSEKVPFDYAINLKVLVENDVRVDSFGLQSKVEGDINISMDQVTPMIATGELNLVQGTYRAFGQDLIIRTGQVGFSGSIEKPYLNIKAIRNPDNTSNGVIAGITLTGNVEQPSLKVFSEPAMDQAQALAYLLNGQPLDEGDSSTDAMLTQLLLAQGVNRSEGMVSKIGESFGLSDVSLSSSGSGDDTKVEISGYVTPGIQVKYSVGIFDSLSEVAVRYQLLSQLYIEVTSGLNQNVDILYKFDWD